VCRAVVLKLEDEVTYLRYLWRTLVGLLYLGIVVAVLSTATTRFETLILAGVVQLYAAVLYNCSVIGATSDLNNYAGFVRFRILAAANGVTENEDGTFEEQEEALADQIKSYRIPVLIGRVANSAVSLYALFKIIQAVS
jgi:hypothetical protein